MALIAPLTPQTAAKSPQRTGHAAVIINPSKFTRPDHYRKFRSDVERLIVQHGWDTPTWLPTTSATKGTAEARAALSAGVDLVVVAGGDGTVRTVAEELAGSGTPLAILPSGTGNLLARNLSVPLHDLDAAITMALEGTSKSVDVGWLDVDYDGDGVYDDTFAFMVMAGAGFDAAIMAGADPVLKARLGPTAYMLSGARALAHQRSDGSVLSDGVEVMSNRSHGFVVGNCGSLTMGLQLMPDADPSDGVLDAVVLLPNTLMDWIRAGWSVLKRSRRTHRLLPRFRSRRLEYRSADAQQVEVDGDVIGTARRVRARVQRAGLIVRSSPSA
ncbi:diacylglycerol kinase family protein [Microbacterium sp.]|uniref:diacylglycerol/lipid kinase family protein n=1 Tax=Microbacterium sp. TaxID=51671 RepID=UPI0027365008|nr:diacylglycerol kinase family protein [Microbacterium sp.]MDP3951673.1 diacylglycerol kinase family protein [Microbacterium sp.]